MRIISVGETATPQPESKMVTVSRLRDSVCLLKYQRNYLETPQQTPPFTSLETGTGGFFHNYLEKHFKQIQAAGEPISRSHRIDVDDLLRSFRMNFVWEGKPRPPFRLAGRGQTVESVEATLAQEGRNFNSFLLSDLVGHRVAGVEGDIEIRTDKLCIYGRYDLITENEEGTKSLWDWKTGMAPKPKEYDEFRNTRLQLGIYAIWMKHRYKLENVPATAVFFRDRAQKISENFSDDVERDVLEFLEDWRKRLNRTDAYPPHLDESCDWCGWNPACDAYQEKFASPKARRGRFSTAVVAKQGFGAAAPSVEPTFRMELLAVVIGTAMAGLLLYLHFSLGIWK